MSKIVHDDPYVAENFLLPFLDIHDIGHLNQLNKISNAYLNPSDEYCPQFAGVFEKYTGEVFDDSLDWKAKIKNEQEETESFPKVMTLALSLRNKKVSTPA